MKINGRTKRETLYWLQRARRNQETYRPDSAAWTMNLECLQIFRQELSEHLRAEVSEGK